MNLFVNIYVIGLICLSIMFGFGYAFYVFMLSLLLALIPVGTGYFFFVLPLAALAYCFLFGHSTFAWISIAYIPFHYLSFMNNIISGLKDLFD